MSDETINDGSFNDFLLWESASRDTIDFKKVYVDIAGDLIAGLMLSQIIYWHLPDKEGKSKLKVKKNNKLCHAKTSFEWWDEIRFNPTQADKALSILRKKRILRTKIYRFNGTPTTHIFLLQKTFLTLINQQLKTPKENPKLEISNVQIRDRESPNQKSLTSLTESTTENTKDNVSEKIESLFQSFSIPKRDRAVFRAVYKDDPGYLLRQLEYTYANRDTIIQADKFIQKALDCDYAYTDQAATENRDRDRQGQKDSFTKGVEKGITTVIDIQSRDNVERNRQRALLADQRGN